MVINMTVIVVAVVNFFIILSPLKPSHYFSKETLLVPTDP